MKYRWGVTVQVRFMLELSIYIKIVHILGTRVTMKGEEGEEYGKNIYKN